MRLRYLTPSHMLASSPRKRRQKVYFIWCRETGHVKIGKAWNPRARLLELQCGNPYPLALLFSSSGLREEVVHETFNRHRVLGEWFTLTADIVAFIDDAKLAEAGGAQ